MERETDARAEEVYDGCVAALPWAAVLTILAARWLPIQFRYRPNDLGIVSLATEQRYPIQQETFWLVFGVVVGALLTWLLARALRGPRRPGAVVALEAHGVVALFAVLWLPVVAALAMCALAGAGAALVARRETAAVGTAPAARLDLRGVLPRRRTALWMLAAVLLAPLLAPGVWVNGWSVANGVPDGRIAYDNFKFLGESGIHLAWANAIWRGGFQGRDIFVLYGPLYDLGLVGFWQLVGRSVAAWDLYWSLTRVAGWIALLWLGGALVRHRAAALVLPFLLPWIEIRAGLALFSLLALLVWLRGGPRAWSGAAGAIGGVSLLYSQEFGTACLIASAGVLAVRRDGRAALAFATGVVAVVAPLFAWFAANGALGPMLDDLVSYPRYMLAGYGKLPFPALTPNLPLDPGAHSEPRFLELRLSYAIPAVVLGAALIALPVSRLDPRRPLATLREALAALARDPDRLALLAIVVFGLVSFRSALGRSSLQRLHAVLPAAALFLCVALDRIISLWRSGGDQRLLASWRAFALALLVAHGGFIEAGKPFHYLGLSFQNVATLARYGYEPVGSGRIRRVVGWVERNTGPTEPVLFLPNIAAYYYLTDRPNPIRFVQGHQIVTDAHRAEVLADLRAEPPRTIVWDPDALRVDGLSDELVFGREILDWIDRHYEIATELGTVRVLRYRGAKVGG